uniref:Uncharacterized protein n=1 Tax=Arundo donax TaxID=35708 RepID=A0A0A9A9B9_ARUDO
MILKYLNNHRVLTPVPVSKSLGQSHIILCYHGKSKLFFCQQLILNPCQYSQKRR